MEVLEERIKNLKFGPSTVGSAWKTLLRMFFISVAKTRVSTSHNLRGYTSKATRYVFPLSFL